MPSWEIHFAIAKKVNKVIRMDENKIVFSNIIPDILAGYKVKNVSNIQKYEVTHFSMSKNINGVEIELPDIKRFKDLYKNHLNNPTILGYYMHLLTDYYWNYYTFENYLKSYDNEKSLVELTFNNNENKILEWDEFVKIKQDDFKEFANYVMNNFKISKLVYDENIYLDTCEIKEICITKDDIKKTIDYINSELKNDLSYNMDNLRIFTQKELEKIFCDTVEFIINNL